MKKSKLFWSAVAFVNTTIAIFVMRSIPTDVGIDVLDYNWFKLMYSLFSLLGIFGYIMFQLAEILDRNIKKFNNWLDR